MVGIAQLVQSVRLPALAGYKMSYFVYVLKSLKDGRKYIGFTRNINERLKRHNAGKVTSTKHRRPFRLISFREFASLKEAINYEKRLKNR